ncbi:DUF7257 domain-containing protein [Nocardia neocaledoniensis]|uniref:DUF7257 domain-containing protein n=1 Tax=Nocardia neocaledoniensis TaxID=236511 RepID=UPI0024545AFA|nr:hypothetical protein [Nocardia neocaledoniensis]
MSLAAVFQPPLAYYADDYNRTNGAIGANYSTDTGQPCVISGNKLQITPQGGGSGAATYVNTWRGGGNDGKMYTDNHEVRVQLTPSAYALATNNPVILYLAGDNGTNATGINVAASLYSGGSTACTIATGSGATGTTRASTATQVATNALVQFRRRGNVFTILVNGATHLTWTDTGGIVPTGASQRRVRVGLSGNFPLFQQQFQCASIDAFHAYDIAA